MPAAFHQLCTATLSYQEAWYHHALLSVTERCPCRSTRETKKAETALAELRGRAEAEKEGLKAAAAGAEERHAAAQMSVAKLEQELQSYKVYAPRVGSNLYNVCGARA